MVLRHYANAPQTTLASSCTLLATTISVSSVSGFPISYPYVLILDKGTPFEEVALVTSGSGTTLTVTRGYDGTTAFAHNIAASVAHGLAAIDIREANQHINTSGAVHGVVGSLVGTTDTQSLTNKTLGNSNTINGFTPSRFMQADGTGKLAASAKTIPGGDVVGTTDIQTLTNKTLDSTSPTAYIPTGVVWEYAGASAPTGWLLCNGAAVSRSTYAALFAIIGTSHGIGDGSTTFNVPDRRDKVAVGASGTKARGSTGGSETVVLSTGNLPPHTHTGPSHTHTIPNHTHTFGFQWQDNSDAGGSAARVTDINNQTTGAGTGETATTSNDGGGTTGAAGTGATGNGPGASTPVSVVQPYVAENFIIKV